MQTAVEEELPEAREYKAFTDAHAREVAASDPELHNKAAEYDTFAPGLAQVFLGEDPTLRAESALARDWVEYL